MSYAEFAAFIIFLYVAIDFFLLAVLDIGGAFEHKLVLSVVLATFCCPQSSNPSVVYSAIHLQLLEDEDEDEDEDIESERFSDTVK